MFSLIITIISIALVAALALATLYYGGSAFNRGNDGATAARLINEGQQVNGAVTIMRADVAAGGDVAATVADLVTGTYLSQVPASFAGTTAIPAGTGGTLLAEASAGVCGEVQNRATGDDTPLADATAAAAAPQVYGCYVDATATNGGHRFFFKL